MPLKESLKKTKRRATEKFLQKLGQSEQTQDDSSFNELQAEFNDTNKQLVVLLSKFQLYAESIERSQRCAEALSKEIQNFVESGSDQNTEEFKELVELSSVFAETQHELGMKSSVIADKWSMQVLGPLRDIAFTLNNHVREKAAERAHDKVDFDAYRRRAKTLTAGDTTKNTRVLVAQRNFNKLAATQGRYEENTKFLMEQYTRGKEKRSLMILHEVAFAVSLQMEHTKSVQSILGDKFSGKLDKFIPSESSAFEKRQNQWFQEASFHAQHAVGYLGSKSAINKSSSGSSKGSDSNHLNRDSKGNHYARNAPRGKQGVFKSIGKQLSKADRKSNNKGETAEFVLPEAKEDSMMSYKVNVPVEPPVTPINVKEPQPLDFDVASAQDGCDLGVVAEEESVSNSGKSKDQDAESMRMAHEDVDAVLADVPPAEVEMKRSESDRTISADEEEDELYEDDFEEIEEEKKMAAVPAELPSKTTDNSSPVLATPTPLNPSNNNSAAA